MAGKIMIVDDVATNRIVLKVKLASAAYETVQAANGTDALRIARQARPDLILLDVQLPDIDGIEVCKRLKADPATRAIPVVMITAFRDPDARLRGLRAGAEEFLTKPLDEHLLLARLRSLLRARETEEVLKLRDTTWRDLGFAEATGAFDAPANIVLVGGRRERTLMLRRDLARTFGPHVSAMDREEVMAGAAGLGATDLFVIPADMDRPGDGLRLMSELRARPSSRHAAICILVGADARETAAVALDLGANDLLAVDAPVEEVAIRLQTQIRRKRIGDRLRASMADGFRLALIDPLTGLYNRRYALPHVARIAERAQQTGRSFAVMLLDLDRFKSVNDTWGHAAGDAVLVEVAQRLKGSLRSVDLVARIGGEEFLIALPDTALDAARTTAERLRGIIEERPVRLPGSLGEITITASVGLAMGGGAGVAVEQVVDFADQALLGSKSDGRNLVTVGGSAAA